MPRHKVLFLAMVAMLCAQPLQVKVCAEGMANRYRGRNSIGNFFTVSVSGGYTNTLCSSDVAKPKGFLGATAGIGYEMHAVDDQLWWSVLGELQCVTSVNEIDNAAAQRLIGECENYPENVRYNVARWHDCPHYMFVSLPVMLGYRNSVFYVGAGPKLMLSLAGRTVSAMDYTVLQDMPEQSSVNYSISPRGFIMMNPVNVASCFEVGVTLYDDSAGLPLGYNRSNKSNLVFKVGVYAEYGLMNLNGSQDMTSMVTINQNDAHTLSPTPLFNSSAMPDKSVHPFYVGVRLTMLFKGGSKR